MKKRARKIYLSVVLCNKYDLSFTGSSSGSALQYFLKETVNIFNFFIVIFMLCTWYLATDGEFHCVWCCTNAEPEDHCSKEAAIQRN